MITVSKIELRRLLIIAYSNGYLDATLQCSENYDLKLSDSSIFDGDAKIWLDKAVKNEEITLNRSIKSGFL